MHKVHTISFYNMVMNYGSEHNDVGVAEKE